MNIAQVSISHPKAAGIDRTVLIICEPKTETNCTITLSEAIVKMKPSDSAKTIQASLDGASATASDATGFNWWTDNYDIVDLWASGTTAVVTPKGSGTVTLHCSHPKSAFEKTCVFYIADYTELAFANDSMELTTGVQTFVNIQVPAVNTSSKLSYSVTDAVSGAPSSGITASLTKSVCVLDRPIMNLISNGGAETLTATLSGGNDDGADEHLVWTVVQNDPNDPVIKVAGEQMEKNRKITILPIREGNATITCLVPSSQKIATCDIRVEAQRSLTLDRTTVEIYPTKQIEVHYTVSLEGISQLTGEAPLGATASILVKNGWNNKFTLSKTTISGSPIVGDSAEEKFRYKIDYTLSPDCCEIYVSNMDNNIILDPACYDEKQVHGKTSTYIIRPGNGHYKIDNNTHTATGTITFIPKGESSSQCEIQPYNPTIVGQNPVGFVEGTQKVVNLKVYYGSYTYGMTVTGRTNSAGNTPSSFTHYTPSAKTIYIGDGEIAKFTVASEQSLSTPKEVKVFFKPEVNENKIVQDGGNYYYRTSANNARTGARWYNCNGSQEVELSGVLVSSELTYSLNLLDDLVPSNTAGVTRSSTVTDVVKAGYVIVRYTPVYATAASEFKFPVYVEVRPNCTATETAFGTNTMNQ